MDWNISKKALVVVAGFALSACTVPTSATSPQQGGSASEVDGSQAATRGASANQENPVVDANFGGGGLSWRTYGDTMYRFTAIERDGEVFICGAYAHLPSSVGRSVGRKFTREAMRLAKVTVDGRTVLRNLRFFYEDTSEDWDNRLVGSETRCSSIREPAGSLDLKAVSVELHSGRYSIRS